MSARAKVRTTRLESLRPTRFTGALIAICIAGFALRVVYVATFTRHLHFGLDTVWYELVAGSVAGGKGFVDPDQFYRHGAQVATAFRPPLYPMFLAAVNKTLGGSRTTYQVAGCAIGTATIAVVGGLGRRIGGVAVGLVAAALAAVSPALLGVDASVMAETIYLPLVALTLYVLVRAIETPKPAWWVAAGALGGAATLARGDGALVVAIVVLPITFVYSSRRTRTRLLTSGLTLLVALAVVAPWLVRNAVQLHRPTLATLDAGTALAGTNCSSTYYGSKLGSWDEACTHVAGAATMSEVQLTDALQHRGLHYAAAHGGRLPLVVMARVARQWGLWDPANEARLESDESRNYHWQLLTWGFDLALLALAVAGWATRRRDKVVAPLALLGAAVTLDAALVYGKQRFQAAAHPALLVLAAVALVALWAHRPGMRDTAAPTTVT